MADKWAVLGEMLCMIDVMGDESVRSSVKSVGEVLCRAEGRGAESKKNDNAAQPSQIYSHYCLNGRLIACI